MPRKTPGKLALPPPQAEFDGLPLRRFTRVINGVLLRLHSSNRATGRPWDPLHFSVRGASRFDPSDGVGTLYVAQTLPGSLLEVFDDRWGAVNSPGRRLTTAQLREWWVSAVRLPTVELFDATGGNLSKIGADAQLVTGGHAVARTWALRMMRHPHRIGGILYASRHDLKRQNVALFRREGLFPERHDPHLTPISVTARNRFDTADPGLEYGPAIPLVGHPRLLSVLKRLEVAILP